MTKEGVLACLKGNNYSAAEVKRLIESIDVREKYARPLYLKIGDIYLNDGAGGGLNKAGFPKKRPCVIISVKDDIVHSIPLTTCDNGLALTKSNYRFGKEGFFTKQIITANKEYALNNFAGVYDNPKRVRKAIKELKEYLNNEI